MTTTYHAWVRQDDVPSWISAGWKALNSLDGTPHGQWSIHLIWDHPSEPVKPAEQQLQTKT